MIGIVADEIIYEGPLDFVFHGRDSQAWRWFLNGREVIVEVTGTAMEADLDTLPPRTADAIRTRGESEIRRMLDWEIPDPHVSLSTVDV